MSDPALENLLKANPAIWRGHYHDTGHDSGNEYADVKPSRLHTGFTALDKALPGGGWQTGTLTELLIEHEGIGEFSLLLPALRQLTQHHWVALIQPPYIPYAPALANAGIRLDHTLIVDTDNDDDTLWSAEQLLRTGLFSAVICWICKTHSRQQRRLQLAAETGQAWAVAYRPATAAKEHSPAALRLSLQMQPQNSLVIDVLKSRGLQTQDIIIQPADFDASQGVEWPGFAAHSADSATPVSRVQHSLHKHQE